jgi:hypothetical protein
MLYRADVSDKALGLLMDRCRATFANPEADGGFTLYMYQVRFSSSARQRGPSPDRFWHSCAASVSPNSGCPTSYASMQTYFSSFEGAVGGMKLKCVLKGC